MSHENKFSALVPLSESFTSSSTDKFNVWVRSIGQRGIQISLLALTSLTNLSHVTEYRARHYDKITNSLRTLRGFVGVVLRAGI